MLIVGTPCAEDVLIFSTAQARLRGLAEPTLRVAEPHVQCAPWEENWNANSSQAERYKHSECLLNEPQTCIFMSGNLF